MKETKLKFYYLTKKTCDIKSLTSEFYSLATLV